MGGTKNHRWEDDKCSNCNLVRKPRALSKNLLQLPNGGFFYDFEINGEWVDKRPQCKSK